MIATETAVMPAAVGVDIGCGMAARRLDVTIADLPDAGLDGWVDRMCREVPAGLGRWHGDASREVSTWLERHPPPEGLDRARVAAQLGTLGSGNHFIELARDEQDAVWILLHSGSRGGGNRARDPSHEGGSAGG